MISFENVSLRYKNAPREALRNISFEIPENSFFALLGPNGAGKTTLLRLLCGRFSPVFFSGKIQINARFASKNGFLDLKKTGILLENPGVYKRLSIEEYLCYFAFFYDVKPSDFNARLLTLSREFQIENLKQKLSSLSLGTLQKIQLMRALIHNPEVLILDEPVANLDPIARELVWNFIKRWRKNGGTAIVSSHILAELENEATHFGILKTGQLIHSNSLSAISKEKTHFILETKNAIAIEQIKNALSAAGIPLLSVSEKGYSLADLYRKAQSETNL